jgi:hypothetical protein
MRVERLVCARWDASERKFFEIDCSFDGELSRFDKLKVPSLPRETPRPTFKPLQRHDSIWLSTSLVG